MFASLLDRILDGDCWVRSCPKGCLCIGNIGKMHETTQAFTGGNTSWKHGIIWNHDRFGQISLHGSWYQQNFLVRIFKWESRWQFSCVTIPPSGGILTTPGYHARHGQPVHGQDVSPMSMTMTMNGDTLPKTNSQSSLQIGFPTRKAWSPNHHFSGAMLVLPSVLHIGGGSNHILYIIFIYFQPPKFKKKISNKRGSIVSVGSTTKLIMNVIRNWWSHEPTRFGSSFLPASDWVYMTIPYTSLEQQLSRVLFSDTMRVPRQAGNTVWCFQFHVVVAINELWYAMTCISICMYISYNLHIYY